MINIGTTTALFLAYAAVLQAQPTIFHYDGDKTPAANPYGPWFTTVGPGHPTGSYFLGTTWSSDGNVLTMRTQHPADYSGATSQGIWFGRSDNYGDPSAGLSFAASSLGNRVDARIALGANSGEWSMYWYDSSGYGSSLYFMANGFSYYRANQPAVFVPVDTTGFHTFSSHVFQGQVSYYLDENMIGSGAALTGASNFLLVGDGSASSVSGYGTMLVDSLTITVGAGAAPVPEPGVLALTSLGLGMIIVRRARTRCCG